MSETLRSEVSGKHDDDTMFVVRHLRDLWNNPIVCNCSSAWLRNPTVVLPSLSLNGSPPLDRCFVDSPGGGTRFIADLDSNHCGRPICYNERTGL